MLRTRKSEEDSGLEDEDEDAEGVMGARVARSDKYLFMVRKDGSATPQVNKVNHIQKAKVNDVEN